MPVDPKPRWGVRFTSNPAKTLAYIQSLYDDNADNVKRGELFLNELTTELLYVGEDGIAKRVGQSVPVPYSSINFSGIREFATDSAAAAATPPIPVGGLYHTGGYLRVRMS
jgi:hypothetical protein